MGTSRMPSSSSKPQRRKRFWLEFTKRFCVNELLVRVAIVVVGVAFQVWYDPFVREVQGKDWPDYAYPYRISEMFSAVTAGLIIFLLSVVVLILGLLVLRFYAKWPLQLVGQEFALFILGITLSGLLDFMTCTIIKKMYGRLRPDYLSRCFGSNDPDVWMPANGFTSWNSIPEIPACTTKAGNFFLSDSSMKDARMSFPSAHSSLSFSVIGFLALWVYSKMSLFREWGAWRIVGPFGLIMVPVSIAVSRTSDYRHHPTDVIGGTIIGVIIAIISFVFYFPIHMVPLASTVYTAYSKVLPDTRVKYCEVATFKMDPAIIPLKNGEDENEQLDPSGFVSLRMDTAGASGEKHEDVKTSDKLHDSLLDKPSQSAPKTEV
eukprot:Gregarina_sp_Pseudo_9__4831@NODE_504_length_2678_cov_50_636605_g475_i0_p1_GENE_NODE_504_length_2678_cov_50_636605_g475_i0NODE_504_length_2678_cov_50_636605_g475_i0_p1_ORF_typecomplete_len392_score46_89PAP2/PF01569_21/1_9e03PAP2/PF01569_21/2_6e26PAP2_3/PF14378_6/0_00026UPF0060/PF02694_15/2_9e03UPF0060/PF02694_15/0_059DUF3169/PF11368_8/0_085DUF3169/PF11368_8/1_6e03DUF2207/PF09972_9/21DUF2207/PF09972_9/1_7_NODE_504_length_2678_cov_50_636605_g475_i015022629